MRCAVVSHYDLLGISGQCCVQGCYSAVVRLVIDIRGKHIKQRCGSDYEQGVLFFDKVQCHYRQADKGCAAPDHYHEVNKREQHPFIIGPEFADVHRAPGSVFSAFQESVKKHGHQTRCMRGLDIEHVEVVERIICAIHKVQKRELPYAYKDKPLLRNQPYCVSQYYPLDKIEEIAQCVALPDPYEAVINGECEYEQCAVYERGHAAHSAINLGKCHCDNNVQEPPQQRFVGLREFYQHYYRHYSHKGHFGNAHGHSFKEYELHGHENERDSCEISVFKQFCRTDQFHSFTASLIASRKA